MIKIDVEGGEFTVLKNSEKILEKYSPTVIMEFIPPKDGDWKNNNHYKAVSWIISKGFSLYNIDITGSLIPISSEKSVLENTDSDNLVFIKSK